MSDAFSAMAEALPVKRVKRAYPRKTPAPPNPWGFTFAVCSVLEAIIENGSYKSAAEQLGITAKAVEGHVYDAKKTANFDHHIKLLIAYDRHMRKKRK